MSNINGKKLLILAGGPNFIDLVERAKELGVYTIVTDYYDHETSPAKKIADEAWDISWDDLDTLESKCREAHVNGITTGYSESTVDRCIQLCGRLGLPCYITREQLDITKDKVLFKTNCRANNVPVVNEYASVDEVKSFPVIVKPVDRAGSIGISVANNPQELRSAYDYAMEMSYCKNVIIEDYITWGNKFDAYYAITDGKITFLSTSDTVNAKDNGFEKVIQSGWLMPSRFQDCYLRKVDPAMRNMISNMGIKNGFIFFSGFSDGDRFVFFETGFRLSGGHMYRYFRENGYPDIQDIFIRHALQGNCDGIAFEEQKGLKAVIINYYAKRGTLSKMGGFEDIARIKECGFAFPICRIGTKCNTDKAILKKLAMIHLYGKDIDQLCDDVDLVNKLFVAEDENGNDMVFDRMDSAEIKSRMLG